MPDREKVIRAWECCNPFNRKCNECPYEKDCYHDGISRHMVADAIALLKEQEEVKPIPPIDESDLWRCGYCHHQIIRCTHQRFCEECGRKIGWEDM